MKEDFNAFIRSMQILRCARNTIESETECAPGGSRGPHTANAPAQQQSTVDTRLSPSCINMKVRSLVTRVVNR